MIQDDNDHWDSSQAVSSADIPCYIHVLHIFELLKTIHNIIRVRLETFLLETFHSVNSLAAPAFPFDQILHFTLEKRYEK